MIFIRPLKLIFSFRSYPSYTMQVGGMVLVMQTQIILLVVLGELNMLAVAALVGVLNFLAQEMVDMALVVVALADKILTKPQV